MERIGVLGRRPCGPSGEVRLLLPSDEFVLVDPGSSHDEIAARYDLDGVVLVPDIRAFTATYLDGPFQGRTNPMCRARSALTSPSAHPRRPAAG